MDAAYFKNRGVVMMRKLFFGMMGVTVLHAVPALSAEYYSVAKDAPSQTVVESAWQETQSPTAWAPQPLEQVLTRGVLLVLPKEELVPQLTWEMDLGILQSDGNIMHLLGTATISNITPHSTIKHATITADLSGVQMNDCRAQLSATVDADARTLLIEKLTFHCLGREVTVATALHPKD
jgi:hypothetical protein